MGGLVAALPAISAGFSVLSGVQGLFAKGPKAEKAASAASLPVVEAPTVMPTQDSALVADAKRRALVSQSQRSGRASTILTSDDSFGGG